MSYSVTCQCGLVHEIAATQAGSELRCSCDRSINVPRLSELRKAAGENAVPQTLIERVKARIHGGELPLGNTCPLSSRPADCVVYVYMQCEQQYLRKSGPQESASILPFMLGGLLGGLLFHFLRSRPSELEVLGRDTSICLPLRIAASKRSKFLKTGQAKLKALLQQTPAYAELLRKYPDAVLTPLADRV